ncbi:MAG: sugar transferase [Candidatus Sumerlaeia bacterium]
MKAFWRQKRFIAFLIAADAVVFSGLWLLTWWLRSSFSGILVNPPLNPVHTYLHALPVFLVFWLAITASNGLYDFSGRLALFTLLRRSLKAGFVILGTTAGLSFFFKEFDLGRSVVLAFSVLAFLYLNYRSTLIRWIKQKAVERGIGRRRVIIVGVNDTTERVLRRLERDPERGYEVIGVVMDDDGDAGAAEILQAQGYRLLGREDALTEIVQAHDVDEVFLALPRTPRHRIMNLVSRCELGGVDVKIVSNIFEVITSEVVIDEIDEFPVIHLPHSHLNVVERFVKRAMDLSIALVLLILGLIPCALVAILIKRDSPGPVFFRQERVGEKGRIFKIWKFRTMYQDVEKFQEAPARPDDPRITRVGRWLRRWSLDEAPQILNVIRGEMSLVGPRPEMPFIVARYEEWQKRRLEVKPGLTGLWQVMGRKNLPLHLNLEYDFYYIKNQSLLLDVIILLRTIPAVLFRRGAY